jgi:hypothetical protein
MTRRILYAESPEWAAIADRIDELIAGPDFRKLKTNTRTLAGLLRCGDREVFVKRVDTGSWAKGIANRMRGSRAARAWRGARLLEAGGFAHPIPIAAFETRSFGAIGTSWFITEPLRKPRILSRFALADGRNFRRREWISAQLAAEIRRLHDAGLYTLDMQETNLMLEAEDRKITVHFIDVEDFRRARKVSIRWRMLNLLHLDRSIGRFISRSQRLRFLYNYLGGKPARGEARRMVARMLAMRDRINRHKQRERRAQKPIAAGASVAIEPPSNAAQR